MTLPDYWDTQDPASLFLALWAVATAWDSVKRVDAMELPTETIEAIAEAVVAAPTTAAAAEAVLSAIEPLWPAAGGPQEVALRDGLVLSGLRVLDEVFIHIHPRTTWLPTRHAPRPRLPRWLADFRETRTLTGAYAEGDGRRLVPRGPFTRAARSIVDVNADTLHDRFVALTAAPLATRLNEQIVKITSVVVGHGATRGVPPILKPGRETVGFAAVAERDGELAFRTREEGRKSFLDVELSDHVDAAARLIAAVNLLGPLDVFVAPELTVSDAAAETYAARLDPLAAPRLSITGSGPRGERDHFGRRFNASSAFNAVGAKLWGHDKVWPYGMGRSQVEECKLGDVPEDQLLMEEMRAGASITVADLDGFGRVLTLICQDFQIAPGVAEVISFYQPDWVFVPVLDKGVGVGRWMHNRAFALSGASRARFVVACSLSLAERAGDAAFPDTPIALMVGPLGLSAPEINLDAQPRAVAEAACTESDPRCGKLAWNSPSHVWRRTNVVAS